MSTRHQPRGRVHLVGGAALTSALAAFGPGGMIGGLLTAGTLVTAGGSSIALGLTAPGTSADAVEAVVLGQLTMAILRNMQGLQQDPQTWNGLYQAKSQVEIQLEKRAQISDPKSPGLKELQRKFDALSRALDYLKANSLGVQLAELPAAARDA